MRFADRDLMMRYTGLGIGHKGNIPLRWIDFSEPTLDPIIEEPAARTAEPLGHESQARDVTPEPQIVQTDPLEPPGDGDEASIPDGDEFAHSDEDWTTWD